MIDVCRVFVCVCVCRCVRERSETKRGKLRLFGSSALSSSGPSEYFPFFSGASGFWGRRDGSSTFVMSIISRPGQKDCRNTRHRNCVKVLPQNVSDWSFFPPLHVLPPCSLWLAFGNHKKKKIDFLPNARTLVSLFFWGLLRPSGRSRLCSRCALPCHVDSVQLLTRCSCCGFRSSPFLRYLSPLFELH